MDPKTKTKKKKHESEEDEVATKSPKKTKRQNTLLSAGFPLRSHVEVRASIRLLLCTSFPPNMHIHCLYCSEVLSPCLVAWPHYPDVLLIQVQYEMEGIDDQWFDAIVLQNQQAGNAQHGRRGSFCVYSFFFFDGKTADWSFESFDNLISNAGDLTHNFKDIKDQVRSASAAHMSQDSFDTVCMPLYQHTAALLNV